MNSSKERVQIATFSQQGLDIDEVTEAVDAMVNMFLNRIYPGYVKSTQAMVNNCVIDGCVCWQYTVTITFLVEKREE